MFSFRGSAANLNRCDDWRNETIVKVKKEATSALS